jgi:hypothetical protein
MNSYQASAVKRRFQMKANQMGKIFNFRPKSVTSLAILLFFVIGAFYIIMINLVSTKGLSLRTMETENTELDGENQRLEVEAARLKSLKVINESATGEVQVGDGTTPPAGTQTPAAPAANNQPITLAPGVSAVDAGGVVTVKPKPKFVPMAHQNYLASYSSSLAAK